MPSGSGPEMGQAFCRLCLARGMLCLTNFALQFISSLGIPNRFRQPTARTKMTPAVAAKWRGMAVLDFNYL